MFRRKVRMGRKLQMDLKIPHATFLNLNIFIRASHLIIYNYIKSLTPSTGFKLYTFNLI